MAIPVWPTGIPYMPLVDSLSGKPYLAPIPSEMDGGNVRQRARPGDNVRVFQQAILVDNDDYADTLEPFLLTNKATRIIMRVWRSKEYRDCLVQLSDVGDAPNGLQQVRVSMTVRVLREIETLEIAGTPVTTATEDVAYAGFQAVASGGVPSYTFSVHSGSLPAGITINAATGVVSGTPTDAGVSSDIVIRVTDANGDTADLAPFTLTVS